MKKINAFVVSGIKVQGSVIYGQGFGVITGLLILACLASYLAKPDGRGLFDEVVFGVKF